MTDAAETNDELKKSQVTLSPPGLPIQFAILGGRKMTEIVDQTKQVEYDTYYEMYRQHPIIRGAIEKIAKSSVTTGFHFTAEDTNAKADPDKEKTLKLFFRKSNALHLLRLSYKDLLIFGEFFWLIEKSVLQTPLRALRLHPKHMHPVINDAGVLTHWRYGPNINDQPKTYRADRIMHVKFDDPDSDVSGLSLLHSLKLTVATDLNAMHFNGNFFENSAQTGLIIIIKSSTGDEAKRNREWLDQNYVGTQNAHRPLLLEGDVDVKPSVNRMTDMQYVEGRVLSRQEIMTVLDIQPEKLNIVEDFRRPQQAGGDAFQQDTISPLQSMLEEEVNNFLILEVFGWDDILFKHKPTSEQNKLDQAKLFHEYQNMGVLSPNQVAATLGYPEVKGGDVHFFQTAAGLIPVDMADEVARRLIKDEPLPDPISGIGTTTTGVRNQPKKTGAEKPRLEQK